MIDYFLLWKVMEEEKSEDLLTMFRNKALQLGGAAVAMNQDTLVTLDGQIEQQRRDIKTMESVQASLMTSDMQLSLLERGMFNIGRASKMNLPPKQADDIEVEFTQWISMMYRNYRVRFMVSCMIKINSSEELKDSINYKMIDSVMVMADTG